MACARFAAIAAIALAACSSNSLQNGSTAGDDGGGDDGSASSDDSGSVPPVDSGKPGSGDENPLETACTAPPFVNFHSVVSMVGASGIAPLAGATVQFTTCVGFQITTAADGTALTQITKGLPVSPIYAAAPQAISAVGAEIPASTDVDIDALLVAQSAQAVVPQYDGKTPTILLHLVAQGTGACAQVDGVTIAATGHPEMVAHYMKAGWPQDTTVASNSSSSGPYAFFDGFAQDGGSAPVTLTGDKSGCQVKLATASQTGRFVLLDRAITYGRATITN